MFKSDIDRHFYITRALDLVFIPTGDFCFNVPSAFLKAANVQNVGLGFPSPLPTLILIQSQKLMPPFPLLIKSNLNLIHYFSTSEVIHHQDLSPVFKTYPKTTISLHHPSQAPWQAPSILSCPTVTLLMFFPPHPSPFRDTLPSENKNVLM